MWNYIQSRMTEMPQIFLGVEFIQALNPLYALPIVAVILCAFLVYAFGFKSPVQPPSFDDIEVDKKTAKKRKVKENQKNKQQNGKAGGSTGKNTDNAAAEKKKKADKATAEKPTPKAETKAMRKANIAEKKKKPSVSQEPDPVVEEGNDEGWVHHISKKGRKNRKKDDVVHVEAMPSVSSQLDIVEIYDSITEDTVKPKVDVSEIKQDADITGVDENESDKPLAKEVAPAKPAGKKQKAKKKDAASNELANDTPSTEELNRGSDAPPTQNRTGSEITANDAMKASKEKKPPRKKKKKHEAVEKEVVVNSDTSTLDSSNPSCIANGSSTDGLLSVNAEKVADIKDLKIEGLNEFKSGDGAGEGEKGVNSTDVTIEATGSNVAFDELEGLYPESQPVKKKKRARRDH